MHFKTSSTLAAIACYLIVGVAALRLSMSPPDHLRVSWTPQFVTFTCAADLALAGCQFSWWDTYLNKAGPLLDLSRGPQSQANTSHLDSGLTGYSYSGRGLGAGDCGVSLQVADRKIYLVACRVRAESGGWTYAWVDFNACAGPLLPHTLTPREAVVLPGGEARLMLRAREPLSYCRFYLLSLDLYFRQGAQSALSTGRHLYLGAGVEGGECGLALSNVSEADNGPLRCYTADKTERKDTERVVALIVARGPSKPVLTVRYAGNRMTATCVVEDSRPAPNITWTVGGTTVRWGSEDDRPATDTAPWLWPWTERTTSQDLVLAMEPKHNGAELCCVASILDTALSACTLLRSTDP